MTDLVPPPRTLFLGLAGRSGAGKTAFTSLMHEAADDYARVKFAQIVHDCLAAPDPHRCISLIGEFAHRHARPDGADIWALLAKSLALTVAVEWPPSPRGNEWRHMAQELGTAIRAHAPGATLGSWMARVDRALAGMSGKRRLIVADDVRFPDEVHIMDDTAGAYDVADSVVVWLPDVISPLPPDQARHATEPDACDILYDIAVRNDGDAEDWAKAGYNLARRLLAGEALYQLCPVGKELLATDLARPVEMTGVYEGFDL